MNSKWGTYPWFIEDGADLIHPDDLEAFKQEACRGSKVFECIEKREYITLKYNNNFYEVSVESDYITLKYNNNFYMVRNKLFKPVPTPKYNFGEIVKIKKNGEEAVITDIMWHYDRNEHFYFISVKNRKKSKRYFEFEFM